MLRRSNPGYITETKTDKILGGTGADNLIKVATLLQQEIMFKTQHYITFAKYKGQKESTFFCKITQWWGKLNELPKINLDIKNKKPYSVAIALNYKFTLIFFWT